MSPFTIKGGGGARTTETFLFYSNKILYHTVLYAAVCYYAVAVAAAVLGSFSTHTPWRCDKNLTFNGLASSMTGAHRRFLYSENDPLTLWRTAHLSSHRGGVR